MTKAEAGRLGGLATHKKYGSEYMRKIGRKGADATWTKYAIQPVSTAGWAMVERETQKVVAVWNTRLP